MTTSPQNQWPELPSLTQRLKEKFGDQAEMVVAKTLFMGSSALKGQLNINVHPHLIEHTIRLALSEQSNGALSRFFNALGAQEMKTSISPTDVLQVVNKTIAALNDPGLRKAI